VTDTDPISETDAGPLLGPAMAVSAAVVTAVALWRLRRRSSLAVPAIAAAASAYLVMLVVGTVGYTIGTGVVAQLVLFPARHALSPYLLGTGLLAGVAVVFLWVVTVRARRDAASGDHLTGR
jgi:O-antigen ligase